MMDAFLDAILAGDRRRALAEARAAFERHGVPYLYESVVHPALVEVGERWSRNEITVADEHLATAIVNATLASLYPDFPWPDGGPKAIVACAAGERHEVGARMVADLLALDGWDAAFLGADTPPEALVRKAVDARAVLVALSVTIPVHLSAARATAALLHEALPTATVLAGGRAVAQLPDAAAALGLDGVAPSGAKGVDAARAYKR